MEISFEKLIPHGKATVQSKDKELLLTTSSSIASIAYNLVGSCYKRHYLELPEKAHIPFTLTMQLKLDHPGLILLIGEGHMLFNCPCSHPLEDPVKPTGKAFLDGHQFDNHVPINQYVTITVSYGKKEMQVLIDGKEAFYSDKQPYMKAKELAQMNEEGFMIGFEAAKRTALSVKKITLTNEDENEPKKRPEKYVSYEKASAEVSCFAVSGKSGFEGFLSHFREDLQQEIKATDAALKSYQNLKIKRVVDTGGEKVTYTAADFGISYSIRRAVEEWQQSFSFYVVTSGTGDTWHRRADYMEEVLQEISLQNASLAERIFYALNDCVGCYGANCLVKTLYSFQGKKRLACHGIVMLNLCPEDFEDVREFFRYLSIMLRRKAEEGTLQTEKIYLMKK